MTSFTGRLDHRDLHFYETYNFRITEELASLYDERNKTNTLRAISLRYFGDVVKPLKGDGFIIVSIHKETRTLQVYKIQSVYEADELTENKDAIVL